MDLIPPFWFIQRQAKAEAVGADTFKLTAPNLGEAFITIRRGDNGRWTAALRLQADGPDVAVTENDFELQGDAWAAAFELYRTHVVI